jgi:vacuolar iron transporter family protein
MPLTPHTEKHFRSSKTIRDIVIGMSDGLTVPFALAAGLAASVSSTGIVVVAGLAEITAGSIAMGLGGYLAAKTDADHYRGERAREFQEVAEIPHEEAAEVRDIFRAHGVADEHITPIVDAMAANPERWVDFMMRFELGLERPDPREAGRSAVTIGLSYILGGLIPLIPYFFLNSIHTALLFSAVCTLCTLFLFGYFKARYTGISPWRGGVQTILVGALASGVAYGLAALISGRA